MARANPLGSMSVRLAIYFVGVVLVLVAAWMLFFEAGLNRWIPVGIAAAALLLIIGISVMGAADRAELPRERTVERGDEVHEHHVHHHER